MGTSKYWVLTLLLLFLGLAAFLGVRFWKERTAWPEGLIQANGRIEGDVISVATKFTGRTEKLFVREGDTVSVGQVMVQLDDVQIRAQVKQTKQAWNALEGFCRKCSTKTKSI